MKIWKKPFGKFLLHIMKIFPQYYENFSSILENSSSKNRIPEAKKLFSNYVCRRTLPPNLPLPPCIFFFIQNHISSFSIWNCFMNENIWGSQNIWYPRALENWMFAANCPMLSSGEWWVSAEGAMSKDNTSDNLNTRDNLYTRDNLNTRDTLNTYDNLNTQDLNTQRQSELSEL